MRAAMLKIDYPENSIKNAPSILVRSSSKVIPSMKHETVVSCTAINSLAAVMANALLQDKKEPGDTHYYNRHAS